MNTSREVLPEKLGGVQLASKNPYPFKTKINICHRYFKSAIMLHAQNSPQASFVQHLLKPLSCFRIVFMWVFSSSLML